MKPRAFTLTELLLVITIIIILAGITVTAISSSRERISLDLMVKKFAGEITQFQSLTRGGYGETLGGKSLCYIISLDTKETPFWMTGELENQNCAPRGGLDNIAFKDLQLLAMELDGAQKKEITLTIIPPDGKLHIQPYGNILTLHLGFEKDPVEQRVIEINGSTGRAEIK